MSKSSTLNDIKYKWDAIKDKSIEFAENVKEKGTEMAHTLETNPQTKGILSYIKKHKKESVLGGFMLLGLIISFWWLGGLIVGLGAGLYAPWGLKGLWDKALMFVEEQGKFSAFILGVTAIFMVFHVFSFFIGGLIGLGVKSILIDEFRIDNSRKNKTK